MKRKSHWIALTALCAGVAVFGLGCEQEIAHTRQTEIEDDGTVKTKEKTVTENPDGSTTVTEERSKTTHDPD